MSSRVERVNRLVLVPTTNVYSADTLRFLAARRSPRIHTTRNTTQLLHLHTHLVADRLDPLLHFRKPRQGLGRPPLRLLALSHHLTSGIHRRLEPLPEVPSSETHDLADLFGHPSRLVLRPRDGLVVPRHPTAGEQRGLE